MKSLACCVPWAGELCLQHFTYKSISYVTFKWLHKLWNCIHDKGPFFPGCFDRGNGLVFSSRELQAVLCSTSLAHYCFLLPEMRRKTCVPMRKIQILSPDIFLTAFLSDTAKFKFLLRKIPPARSINLTREFALTLENINALWKLVKLEDKILRKPHSGISKKIHLIPWNLLHVLHCLW